MFNDLFNSLTSVALAIVGLGIIAVLVSRNANTAGVTQAASQGFATDLLAAETPVTGGGSSSFNMGNFGSLGGLTGIGLPQG